MKRLLAGGALGLLALSVAGSMAWSNPNLPIVAQSAPPKAVTNTRSLPVTQAVLYTNGVGYFEREGTLPGGSDIEITCRLGEVNDLLKSLTVQDLDGGKAGTVTLASPSDPDSASAGLENFLENNPGWQEILLLARGTQVEVTLDPPSAAAAVPAPVTGMVLSLETPPPPRQVEVIQIPSSTPSGGGLGFQQRETTMPVKNTAENTSVLSRSVPAAPPPSRLQLLTNQGYVTIKLEQIRQVKLLDAALEQRIRQALSKVQRPFEALGNQLTSVRLHVTGEGQRRIRIGYLREQPLWKTCYRLMLDPNNQAQLQGWAIVENTSDEDWQQIKLKLVSGQPVSFRMDLHTTLQPTRPEAMVPSYKPFLPRGYQALFDRQSGPVASLPDLGKEVELTRCAGGHGMGGLGGGALGGGGLGGGGFGGGGLGGGMGGGGYRMPRETNSPESNSAEQDAARQAAPVGSYFEYLIAEPVSLQQGKTTMVPMLQMALPVERLSLYQAEDAKAKALLALRLRNESSTLLAAGPISLFENRQFIGEAQLPEVAIGAKTFVTYGVDAGLSINTLPPRNTVQPVDVEIRYGSLRGFRASVSEETSRMYELHNRNKDGRRVILEQRRDEKSTLLQPGDSPEGDEHYWRFLTEVKPAQRGTFNVTTSVRRACSDSPTRNAITVESLGQALVDLEELPVVPGKVTTSAGYLVISNKQQRRYRYTLQAQEKGWTGNLYHSIDYTWSVPQLPANAKWEGDTLMIPVALQGKSTINVDVHQEKATLTTSKLGRVTAVELQAFLTSYELPAGLKATLEQALELQTRKSQVAQELSTMDERLKEIDQEQTRLRANMKDLPKDAPLYKRYLDKFDKQEQEIDESRGKAKQHRQTLAELDRKLTELERSMK